MEAAASLFGAEGSASDPFSNLGDDSGNDTSKDTGAAAAPAGDLFGGESAAGGDFFDQIASGNDGGNVQESASAVGNGSAGYATSAAAQTPQANGTQATYGQQGYYAAQHQWQPGGQQQSENTHRGALVRP